MSGGEKRVNRKSMGGKGVKKNVFFREFGEEVTVRGIDR